MLSVIIPSLNAEETLGATVQALRAGADGDLIREIILVFMDMPLVKDLVQQQTNLEFIQVLNGELRLD